MTSQQDDALLDQAVRRLQLMAGAMVAGVLLLTAVIGLIEQPAGPGSEKLANLLAKPVALLGIVSPVVGYRLWLLLLERVPPTADTAHRCREFQRATLLALAVTEFVAFLGIVVWFLTSDPYALVGVLTHVLLAGAIWPSRQKLERD